VKKKYNLSLGLLVGLLILNASLTVAITPRFTTAAPTDDIVLDVGDIIIDRCQGVNKSEWVTCYTVNKRVGLETGCTIVLNVDYQIACNADEEIWSGLARIETVFVDNQGNEIVLKDQVTKNSDEGTLSISRWCNPGDVFRVTLYGKLWWSNFYMTNTEDEETGDSTVTTYYSKASLAVEPSDIHLAGEAGKEISFEFTVKNAGTDGSLLNWYIKHFSGEIAVEWTADITEGNNLPVGCPVTVTVSGPLYNNPTVDGQILIKNRDDFDNSCSVSVHIDVERDSDATTPITTNLDDSRLNIIRPEDGCLYIADKKVCPINLFKNIPTIFGPITVKVRVDELFLSPMGVLFVVNDSSGNFIEDEPVYTEDINSDAPWEYEYTFNARRRGIFKVTAILLPRGGHPSSTHRDEITFVKFW